MFVRTPLDVTSAVSVTLGAVLPVFARYSRAIYLLTYYWAVVVPEVPLLEVPDGLDGLKLHHS
jgi:hypothetical protein